MASCTAAFPSYTSLLVFRVGCYTEKVLNYLRARAHPRCEVSWQGVSHKALTEKFSGHWLHFGDAVGLVVYSR